MGVFDVFRRNKNNEERAGFSRAIGSTAITSYFGQNGGINEASALTIPTVSACVDLITSSIAQLPVYLYQENEDGEVIKVPDDYRVFLLNNEPNELMTGYNYKKQITKDYLLYGASFSKVERKGNNVKGLYNLPIEFIQVTWYRTLGYKYTMSIKLLTGDDGILPEFFPEELVMIMKNVDPESQHHYALKQGILAVNEDILQLALDEQDYTASILKNGALPIGILKAAGRLTQPVIDKLRSSWENLYGGAKKAGKTVILEEGMDYSPISMKPNELDLTNVRKDTVSQITRIFNVPESMINASANKYGSLEQNNLQFLQYCVGPIISQIEAALDRQLLLESDKEAGYFFRFDTSEMLRTTEENKINTVLTAMKGGLFSINEARAKVDLPPIPTDLFQWSLGNVFYNPETNQMTIPNTSMVIDPDDPESSFAANQLIQQKNQPLADNKSDDSKKDDSKDDQGGE